MSLGGDVSTALDEAVQNAIKAGVTFVVAAGNEDQDACNTSPARAVNAITAGATTDTDDRALFSNYGTCVDIFAPGTNITSAWSTGRDAINTISGTSMASPHVAGVAALYLQNNPTATPAVVANTIIGKALRGRLNSVDAGSPNRLLYSLLLEPPPFERFEKSEFAVNGGNVSSGSWQTGDIDADGDIDLIHITGGSSVDALISNGRGSFTTRKNSPGGGYDTSLGTWKVGDINGDGKTDLVHITGRNYIHTWISNGDGTFKVGFFTPGASYNTSLGTWQTGDINGDGRADLIHIVDGNYNYVHPWISNGDGTFNVTVSIIGSATGVGLWLSGDATADGRMDLFHLFNNVTTSNVNTWRSYPY